MHSKYEMIEFLKSVVPQNSKFFALCLTDYGLFQSLSRSGFSRQKEGSMQRGTGFQAQQPEFDPWDPVMERELTP